jgi:hypothetical protein
MVNQYTSTPRGDIDGPNLNDGTQVKLPPHLTGQIVFTVCPGAWSRSAASRRARLACPYHKIKTAD